jgi:hypothetical protein
MIHSTGPVSVKYWNRAPTLKPWNRAASAGSVLSNGSRRPATRAQVSRRAARIVTVRKQDTRGRRLVVFEVLQPHQSVMLWAHSRRPQMVGHALPILDAVSRPDVREDDPVPGRERARAIAPRGRVVGGHPSAGRERDTGREMPEEPTTPELVELSRRLVKAVNVGGLDAMMSFYASDCVWEIETAPLRAWRRYAPWRMVWLL